MGSRNYFVREISSVVLAVGVGWFGYSFLQFNVSNLGVYSVVEPIVGEYFVAQKRVEDLDKAIRYRNMGFLDPELREKFSGRDSLVELLEREREFYAAKVDSLERLDEVRRGLEKWKEENEKYMRKVDRSLKGFLFGPALMFLGLAGVVYGEKKENS